VNELKLDGIKAASINGDKSQGARQKALDDFKSGKVRARDEEYLLQAIENLLDTRLPQEWLAGFEPSEKENYVEDTSSKRTSRSAEKRKLKQKLKIHQGRGKKR